MFICVVQVDAGGVEHADWQEGPADQWDLPAERRHRPPTCNGDAAAFHQPVPAGHHLTGVVMMMMKEEKLKLLI